MSISTKTGDLGKTDLIGERVDKNDSRIIFNGLIDELCSYWAYLGLLIKEHGFTLHYPHKELIKDFSSIMGEIAYSSKSFIILEKNRIDKLDEVIKNIESAKGALSGFVNYSTLDSIVAHQLNLFRCKVRQAELYYVNVLEEHDLSPLILKYLNRLSDYIFLEMIQNIA